MSRGRFAAVDLGASSGRVMVGEVGSRHRCGCTAAARFPNEPVRTEDGLHWDVAALVDHAVAGLATAYAEGPLTSIGVDSWAVDYGRLRDGRLLGQPFHYRDERAPRGVRAPSHALIGARGALPPQRPAVPAVQHALPARRRRGPGARPTRSFSSPTSSRTCLPAQQVAERTNASTTGLLDVTTARVGHRADDPARGRPGTLPRARRPRPRVGDLSPHVAQRVGRSRACGRRRLARHRVRGRRRADADRRRGVRLPRHLGASSASSSTQPVLTEEARARTSPTRAASTDGAISAAT